MRETEIRPKRRPAGAVMAAAIGALWLATAPAAAQETGAETAPAASPFAVVEPCAQPHFDPDTYHEDLTAQGWRVAGAEARPAALDALADAQMPLVAPGFDWAAEGAAEAAAAARGNWTDLAAGRDVYVRDGAEALLFRGLSREDGTLRFECFIAAGPEGAFAELFVAFENAGLLDEAAGIRRAGIAPRPIEGGGQFSLYATDARGLDADLAAPIGILVRIDRAPD